MDNVRSTAIFWVGVSGIAAWAWSSVPQIHHPLGSDWGHYFTVAEYIWDPKEGLAYPDFRKPWFGWLVGGIGQVVGYFPAAQLIGKVSMVAMVFAAALMGSALANRWAGLASAFVVPLMPLIMDGALWVNHYPVLGACVGMSLASGTMIARSRHWAWPCVAGLLAGTAYALDLRGSIALPMVVALAVSGSLGKGWVFLLKRLLAVCFCAGLVLAHDAWLQRAFDVPQLPFQAQLEVQRKGTLSQIQQGVFDNPTLQQACVGQKVGQIDQADVISPCGRVLAEASRQRLSAMKIIPPDVFLWWIPFACIPAGRRSQLVRSTASSVIVFGAPLISVWVGMRWVTYFDRYLMPFAVLFATLVPVGMARFGGLVARVSKGFRGWIALLSAMASMWIAVNVWPGWTARALDAPELAKSSEYHAGVFAQWARSTLGPDDAVVDCAGLAVDSLMLPDKIDYVRFPPGDPECNQRIQDTQPTGNSVFLITMHRDIPPQYGANYLAFNPSAIAEYGWEPVGQNLPVDGFRLWQRR